MFSILWLVGLYSCFILKESDLHKKRTGHTEFIDKTLEAAKPISLEVPKVAKESEEAVAAGSPSEPEGTFAICIYLKFQGKIVVSFSHYIKGNLLLSLL